MSTRVIVSDRGKITLPAAIRKRWGIKDGVVVEIDLYSDAQIAEWDAADRLDDGERERIVGAVTRR